MRFLSTVAVVLPLALTSVGCDIQVDQGGVRGLRIGEGRAEDVWTKTYTVGANGTLEVAGRNGQIVVQGGDGPQVEVRAERQVRANDDETARELLHKLQILEEVTPDRVRLSTAGEEDASAPGAFGRRAQARVSYQVRAPSGLQLALRTDNGGVRLENVDGRITVNTTNGGITGDAVTGSLNAETVNGAVRVDLAAIEGDVRLATTNGTIRLSMPPGARVTLDATVVNGGIDVDDEFNVDAPEGRNQRLTAPINGGGAALVASSVNGSIRIRVRD